MPGEGYREGYRKRRQISERLNSDESSSHTPLPATQVGGFNPVNGTGVWQHLNYCGDAVAVIAVWERSKAKHVFSSCCCLSEEGSQCCPALRQTDMQGGIEQSISHLLCDPGPGMNLACTLRNGSPCMGILPHLRPDPSQPWQCD